MPSSPSLPAPSVPDIWPAVRARGVAAVPSPLPPAAWQQLYTDLEALTTVTRGTPALAARLNDIAKEWQRESGLRLHYSGYFSPYYRDRVGQADTDQKVIFQLCAPYYAYLYAHHPEVVSVPEFGRLLRSTFAALMVCEAYFDATVTSLRDVSPAAAERLLARREGSYPTSLRLLRYVSDAQFCTDPHIDKSAFTAIVHTDDPTDDRCLVTAPPWASGRGHPLLLSQFSVPAASPNDALVFLGSALDGVRGHDLIPTPHAVKPPARPRVRHSSVFFWLLPGVDLAARSTDVDYVDDLGSARQRPTGAPARSRESARGGRRGLGQTRPAI